MRYMHGEQELMTLFNHPDVSSAALLQLVNPYAKTPIEELGLDSSVDLPWLREGGASVAPAAGPVPSAVVQEESDADLEFWRRQPPEFILSQVHGGRNGHPGVRRTWKALNDNFQGHRIPYSFVEDYVSRCPRCQKDRIGMTDTIRPVYRHLKPPTLRSSVGVDHLTVTPMDEYGNTVLIAVVEQFSHFCAVYPAKDYSAVTAAKCLLQFFTSYGVYDHLLSDPGSAFMSDVVKQLNEWLGIRHKVSLVDRHESNGVEGSNREIIRHLRALVHDFREEKRWSDPSVLCLVQFTLNDSVHSETGVRPFAAKFGSEDAMYFKLPDELPLKEQSHAFIKLLDADLRKIRAASLVFQQSLISARSEELPEIAQNQFQPGDFVLFQQNPDQPLPTKLSSPFLGPFEVHPDAGEVFLDERGDVAELILHRERAAMDHATQDEHGDGQADGGKQGVGGKGW